MKSRYEEILEGADVDLQTGKYKFKDPDKPGDEKKKLSKYEDFFEDFEKNKELIEKAGSLKELYTIVNKSQMTIGSYTNEDLKNLISEAERRNLNTDILP